MMGENSITVIVVNYFSMPLIGKLIQNLQAKAKCPETVKFLIVDNTNGEDLETEKLAVAGVNLQVQRNQVGDLQGSSAHAAGLNAALPLLDTEYALTVDPDVYVFKQKWEDFLIRKLRENQAVAIGSPYPPWQLGKYHHSPSPVFCCFRVDAFREMEADWQPFVNGIRKDGLNFLQRMMLRLGLLVTRRKYVKFRFLRGFCGWLERIFAGCSPDTGWRIAARIKRDGQLALPFETVFPEYCDVFPEERRDIGYELSNNYELYSYQGEVMMSHKYSNRSWLWRTPHGDDLANWQNSVAAFDN